MSQVPAIVITGPGTNRDHDVRQALELAGASVRVVLATELVARPSILDEARLAVAQRRRHWLVQINVDVSRFRIADGQEGHTAE